MPNATNATTEIKTETSGLNIALKRTINAAMIAIVPSVFAFIFFSFFDYLPLLRVEQIYLLGLEIQTFLCGEW